MRPSLFAAIPICLCFCLFGCFVLFFLLFFVFPSFLSPCFFHPLVPLMVPQHITQLKIRLQSNRKRLFNIQFVMLAYSIERPKKLEVYFHTFTFMTQVKLLFAKVVNATQNTRKHFSCRSVICLILTTFRWYYHEVQSTLIKNWLA